MQLRSDIPSLMEYLPEKTFHLVLNQIKSDILNLFNTSEDCTILAEKNGDILITQDKESFLSIYKNSSETKLITDVLFSSYKESEKIVPASGLNTILYGLSLLDSFEEKENPIDFLENLSRVPKEENIKNILNFFLKDPKISNAVLSALKIAGFDGRIILNKGFEEEAFIKVNSGFKFKLAHTWEWFYANQWNKKNPKVIVIDGNIESVAEINNLLVWSNETKTPLAIFAYSFNNEVFNTLKVNMEQKKLDVYPFPLPANTEAEINQLSDIATICGASMVSKVKGDIISTIKQDRLVEVDEINAIGNSVTILSKRGKKNADKKIQELLSNASEMKLEDFSQRLKSLSSKTVSISLDHKNSYERNINLANIHKSINLVKSTINSGYIKKEDLKDNKLLMPLLKNFPEDIPASYLTTIIKNGYSLASVLKNTSSALIIK